MRTINLKTTARRLLRQKRFSLINQSLRRRLRPKGQTLNILGLSIGLAACLLIFLYVRYELSYDAYNEKVSRIVRVTSRVHSPESDLALATTPEALAPELLKECPEIEAAVRLEGENFHLREKGEIVNASDFYYSEPSLFSIFSFSFLEGAAAGALEAPYSIVLTRSTARHYLGDGPALGKTLQINGETYRVTAVVRDRPANTDLPINAVLSKRFPAKPTWTDFDVDVYTFLLFHGRPDLQRFNSRLPGITNKYTQAELDRQGISEYHFNFEGERLADVHFSKNKLEDSVKGNRPFLTLFGMLAVFILVIALLNFVNLSTATAVERSKEVGVRKVIGAGPGRLIRQFLLESTVLVGIAWVVAILLVLLVMPYFNRLLSVGLTIGGGATMLLPVLLFPLTVLLAGGYPAFVLSRFSPLKALRGHPEKETRGVGLRRLLTVAQFVIALVMLTGTIAIHRQMQYVEHKDLGADRTGVLCVRIPGDSVGQSAAPAFIGALRHETAIREMSVGSGLPAEGVQLATTTGYTAGKKRVLMVNYFFVDPLLLPILHIALAEGRNFSESMTTDKQEAFLVNEAFVRTMNWKKPLGQSLEGSGVKGKVVGVVKDFFYKSLHNMIEPAVLIYKTEPPMAVLMRTAPNGLARVRQLWKSYVPVLPFDFYFMDENFDAQYAADRVAITLFNTFTGLAVFLCLIGLYGLVSLVVVRRTKELAIRKVLGAPVIRLLGLFTNDLLWQVGIAAAVALPIAGIGVMKWLDSYAYHTGLSVWVFLWPVLTILALTMGVTGWRSVRAALANPADSLRSE